MINRDATHRFYYLCESDDTLGGLANSPEIWHGEVSLWTGCAYSRGRYGVVLLFVMVWPCLGKQCSGKRYSCGNQEYENV